MPRSDIFWLVVDKSYTYNDQPPLVVTVQNRLYVKTEIFPKIFAKIYGGTGFNVSDGTLGGLDAKRADYSVFEATSICAYGQFVATLCPK